MSLLYSIAKWFSSAPSEQPGFDAQFIPPLRDGLKCSCCRLGLRNPVQTHCGHRFCKGCIDKSIRSKGQACPVSGCEQALGYWKPYYPDNFAKQEILCQNVCCPLNRTYDCPWKGPLQDLEYHLETTCPFTLVKCDCGCEILRRDLQFHVATGCPRTKDWRMETTGDKVDGNEVSPVAYPIKESDISSSPGQITGIRYPVEHHAKGSTSNVNHSMDEVGKTCERQQCQTPLHQQEERENTNELAPSEKLKNPLSHKKGQGETPVSHHEKPSNGLEVYAKPSKPLLYQEEDNIKATRADALVQKPKESLVELATMPKESLVHLSGDGILAKGLDPPAKPREALPQGKEDGDKGNMLDLHGKPSNTLQYQVKDDIQADGLNVPVQKPKEPLVEGATMPKEPLVHHSGYGTGANRLNPPAKPREASSQRKEDGDKSNMLDLPDKPKNTLQYQVKDDIEVDGLVPPPRQQNPILCEEEDCIKANGLEVPFEKPKDPWMELTAMPKEPLVCQEDGVVEANVSDLPGEPKEASTALAQGKEDDNKDNGLDLAAKTNEPLLYQEEDKIEANQVDPPDEPIANKPFVGQMEDGGEALNPPALSKEPMALKKEDGHRSNRLDPPDKPNESLVHQKEDDNKPNGLDPSVKPDQPVVVQKQDGDEANGINPPVKPVVPSPCQGEDASGLAVSSQNHVPFNAINCLD